MSHAIPKLVPPTHYRRPRRSTRRADVKVCESRRLFVEAIKIRRPQHFVAHAREVAHPLIVSHDENDVGLRPGKRITIHGDFGRDVHGQIDQ